MPPPQQQQPQGDNSLAALWLTLFLFAACGVIWYLFHDQIVWFVLKIKYYEALFISLFTRSIDPAVQALHGIKTSGLAFGQVATLVNMVSNYSRYPLALILIILAVILFYGHPALRFKRTHTMKSLLEQEKYNWPQIMPVSTVDLVKTHVEKGIWSMALTPMQFAKHFRLIYEERPEENIIKIGTQRGSINVGLLRAEAHQAFAMQLGAYFRGVDKLNMHTKALFGVFAARANRDENSAKEILERLALSSINGHLDFSGTEELLNKYKDTALVVKVIERHAFVLTMMASMLELAREDGVLASADFLWLKLVDRPLWYMLNAVGRQTPTTEVSGPFAHWLAEKKLGRRISVPMVDEAVKALDMGLKDVIYVPDEQT